MITPYNRLGETHEIGGAYAYNKWVVEKIEDALYFKTYPTSSFSIFHNASYTWGNFGGIGGVELIATPLQWSVPDDVSGLMLYLKPYAGFQYSGPIATCRINFSPLIVGIAFGDSTWTAGGDLSKYTLYQFTFLFHNPQPSIHTYWGGIRIAPRAVGLVGGYEYAFNDFTTLRAEYSYLTAPPFAVFISEDEYEAIRGSVHYVTFGIFTRIK